MKLLIKHNFTESSIPGYDFQEYHMFNSASTEIYKKFVQTSGFFGDWSKIDVQFFERLSFFI